MAEAKTTTHALAVAHLLGTMLRDTEEGCNGCSASRVFRSLEWCDVHHGGRAVVVAVESLLTAEEIEQAQEDLRG